jgi:uncharacterized cupredoxin-like copper-binding protein
MTRKMIITAAVAALLHAMPAVAEDMSSQTPIELTVMLGTVNGNLIFEPAILTFETGRLYKLVLSNPSSDKHYFSALEFANAVWTRKVQTVDAEIKGAITEIELLPGGSAEWFFVPVKAGEFALKCTIAGHAEGGMLGTIIVR